MFARIATISVLAAGVLAEPQITAAARLLPRATDPAFVGYISANGQYTDGRSCDYPQTVSTSGNYVQCCPTSGACPFYTACTSNTLYGAGTSVPCDVNSALTCNTAIVETSIGASGGGSYLACWQKTLGSGPITFVQNLGTNTAVATGMSGNATASVMTNTGLSSNPSSRPSTPGLSAATQVSGSTTITNGASATSAATSVGSSSKAAGDRLGLGVNELAAGGMAIIAGVFA